MYTLVCCGTSQTHSFCVPQIIQVNLTSENPQPLTTGASLVFTYQVKWSSTDIAFRRRFERYLDYNFFEHQVRCSIYIYCMQS